MTWTRICPECRREFQTDDPRQKYCSWGVDSCAQRCANRAFKRRKLARQINVARIDGFRLTLPGTLGELAADRVYRDLFLTKQYIQQAGMDR